MAANLNKVFLMGNLTRDPEIRYTSSGTAVANFSIAVNRSYKGGDGEFKKEVNFFKIIVWGKTGENCSKYLAQGKAVLVEGRLNNNSYETKEGQKRVTTEIVADNVQFLSSGKSDSHEQGQSAASKEAAEAFGGIASDGVAF